MADESGIDDLPIEDSAPAQVPDTDPSRDDGAMVGISETDEGITGEVDTSTPAEVAKEDGQDDEEPEPEPEAEKQPWDKKRQQLDQTIAVQKLEIEKLKADQAPEPETEPTPETGDTDFDTLFDKAEASETEPVERPAGDTPDDLDDVDEIDQRLKTLTDRLEQTEARQAKSENVTALKAAYAKAIETHKLDTAQTAALHKRVQAEFKERGHTQTELPGKGEFSDILELAATRMELEVAKKPPTRRRPAKPATPRPSGGSGAPAKALGTPTKLATMDQAIREMEADPDKEWLKR